VPSTVISVLQLRQESESTPLDTLVKLLKAQYMLIVLDNCEHVIDMVAKMADVIGRNCPRVSLIVTSREPLGVDGERVYRVRSLSLPADDAEGAEELEGSDAVELFVARARARDSTFELNNAVAPLVASVCRRLDGIPLAIELAASRLSSMSLEDLHDRLDQRFRLLTGGSRNALPRQQTLGATVAWSYDLLTDLERDLLRRLSVFAGGFDLRAAEAVCTEGGFESFDSPICSVRWSTRASSPPSELQRHCAIASSKRFASTRPNNSSRSVAKRRPYVRDNSTPSTFLSSAWTRRPT
jgi:predicted ATPase